MVSGTTGDIRQISLCDEPSQQPSNQFCTGELYPLSAAEVVELSLACVAALSETTDLGDGHQWIQPNLHSETGVGCDTDSGCYQGNQLVSGNTQTGGLVEEREGGGREVVKKEK